MSVQQLVDELNEAVTHLPGVQDVNLPEFNNPFEFYGALIADLIPKAKVSDDAKSLMAQLANYYSVLGESVDGLDGGLTSAVIGRTEMADAAHELNVGNGRLWVYPSGPLPPTPAELLGSKQANQIFESLRDSVDIVVVDSPPVLPVADALVLSSMADATLLVANAERTRRNELVGAFEALDQAGARLVGTILNQALAGGNDTYYEYGRGYTIKPHRQRLGVGRRRRSSDRSATPWQSLLNPDDLPRFEAATRAHSNPDGVSTTTDSE